MANRYTIGSGNASSPAIWDGGATVPAAGDRVLICSGHTVTLDGTVEWGDDSTSTVVINSVSTTASIYVAGTLKASRVASSQLTCKGMMFVKGVLDFGTEADPIPLAYTTALLGNYSGTMVTGKYGIETLDLGVVKMWGATRKRNTTLTATASIGATSISVSAATGWQVGDQIVVASSGTGSSYDQSELRVIDAAYTPGALTVPLTAALTYAHTSGRHVGNFSSNVTFKPQNATYPSYMYIYWNTTPVASSSEFGHVRFENNGSNALAKSYGALTIWPSSAATAHVRHPFRAIESLAFFRNNATSSGVGWCLAENRNNAVMTNACHYSTVANYAGYMYSNGSFILNDYVDYRSGGINTGYSAGAIGWTMNRCYLYGTTSYALSFGSATGIVINDSQILSCSSGVWCGTQAAGVEFNRCKFGDTGTTNNSTGWVGYGVNSYGTFTLNDCVFNNTPVSITTTAANIVGAPAHPSSYIKVSNKNLDPLLQEIYTPAGNILRDNAFAYDASGSSLRLDPKSASLPLAFSLSIYAPNNKPIVVSGYIYITSYGAVTPPTVTLSGLGVSDTWTADLSAPDTWQQFKVAVTQTTGSDAMLSLTFTAQSATANAAVWIDGVSAPTPIAVNSGEFGYWDKALPASIISANYVAASEVWNVQTSDVQLAGSVGEFIQGVLDANIKQVNSVQVTGSGTTGDPWGSV